MTLSRFIQLWTHPDYAPEMVSPADLVRAEHRLQTRLPKAYRDAVLGLGLPRPTIRLLDVIVDCELDLRDVSEFLDPDEIITATESWRDMGLPQDLVAFAADCMGNLFCFPAAAAPEEDSPVVWFDHEGGSVELVAPSFVRWIDAFRAAAPN